MTIERARAAADQIFPDRTIIEVSDLNRGRGVFSEVYRVAFAPPADEDTAGGAIESVAVKLAVAGPNGDAARRSGGYGREALAYRSLLPHLDVSTPTCHAVIDDPLGPTFVLEDLSHRRIVDQLDGLSIDEAISVAEALGRLHASSSATSIVADTRGRPARPANTLRTNTLRTNTLRTNTVASLDPAALRLGLRSLAERWGDVVDLEQRRAFTRLVDGHAAVAERFSTAGPIVLCHGDPRADNLVFGDAAGRDRPTLFDWQQIALQPGVGDLAWLVATSLDPGIRQAGEAMLVSAYEASAGVVVGHDAYRAGFALPGLAVLYLAQRESSDDRTTAFIATSVRRIGRALVDLEVADLAGV